MIFIRGKTDHFDGRTEPQTERQTCVATKHSRPTRHHVVLTCAKAEVMRSGQFLNQLQAVINTAARLVCHARKADHITPVLNDLHWLRIHERIQYKLCVLAFKCQHSLAPPYLSDQLQQVARMEPRHRLRSSSSPALVAPGSRRSSLGDRGFLVAAARAWNSLQ